MSLLDTLLSKASGKLSSQASSLVRKARKAADEKITEGVNKAAAAIATKKKEFSFAYIPKTIEEFKALPEASQLTDPFATAALTVLAYAAYAQNKDTGLEMFNYVKGPAPMSQLEIQRTRDSLLDEKTYIPMSYFEGATVENDYTPSVPYKVEVIQTSYSKDPNSDEYMKLYVNSAGADSLRFIALRMKLSTKEWFLNDHAGLLPNIRIPKSTNPWA